MTQTHESPTLLTPARRRALTAAPVLIRIPDLTSARAPGRRARRRRLRREVRVAGSILLALLPASMLLACLGGDRPARVAAASLAAAEAEPARIRETPAVSLSLEPVAAGAQDPEAPVFLPGILLPAESTEEDADGRY